MFREYILLSNTLLENEFNVMTDAQIGLLVRSVMYFNKNEGGISDGYEEMLMNESDVLYVAYKRITTNLKKSAEQKGKAKAEYKPKRKKGEWTIAVDKPRVIESPFKGMEED